MNLSPEEVREHRGRRSLVPWVGGEISRKEGFRLLPRFHYGWADFFTEVIHQSSNRSVN